jgi:hypothetical protein
MGLLFDAAAERVNFGSAASLDNITTGTFAAWIKPISENADSYILTKWAAGTAGKEFSYDAGGNIKLFVGTVDGWPNWIHAEGNTSPLTAGSWSFIAAVWDSGGADGDQELYHGSLSTLVAEVGGYATQQRGSGALVDESALDLLAGENEDLVDSGNDTIIAWVGVWDVVLTVSQLQQQQFRLGSPVSAADCQLFCHHGYNGVGTQADLSGTGNTGTVTNATVDDHVPLGPFFGWDEALPRVVVAAGANVPQKYYHYAHH